MGLITRSKTGASLPDRGDSRPRHAGKDDRERRSSRSRSIIVFVDIREGGPGTNRPGSQRRYMLRGGSNRIIPCGNPRCRDGGLSTGAIVKELLERGETEQLRLEVCPGLIATGVGNAAGIRCQNLFGVRVRIQEQNSSPHF